MDAVLKLVLATRVFDAIALSEDQLAKQGYIARTLQGGRKESCRLSSCQTQTKATTVRYSLTAVAKVFPIPVILVGNDKATVAQHHVQRDVRATQEGVMRNGKSTDKAA